MRSRKPLVLRVPAGRSGTWGGKSRRRSSPTNSRSCQSCPDSTGRAIHEEPTVPNVDIPQMTTRLTEGLVITIEPIISAGSGGMVESDDGWTVKTADGSLSAHHETHPRSHAWQAHQPHCCLRDSSKRHRTSHRGTVSNKNKGPGAQARTLRVSDLKSTTASSSSRTKGSAGRTLRRVREQTPFPCRDPAKL